MGRWTLAMLAGLTVAAVAGGSAAARRVEERVGRDAVRVAAGMGASIRSVRVSWLAPVRLEGVTARPDAQTRITADAIEIEWRVRGGSGPRAHVAGLAVQGIRLERGPLAIELPTAAFDVLAWDARDGAEHVRLRQRPGGGTIDVRFVRAAGRRQAQLALADVDLSAARGGWAGQPILEPGRCSGRLALSDGDGRADTEGALSLRAARVSLGPTLGLPAGAPVEPTDLDLSWSARRQGDVLEVAQATARLAGLSLAGHGSVRGPVGHGRVDAELSAEAELGGALRAAGLRLPEALDAEPRARLGTAWFEVSLRGPLWDAAALHVMPRLRFESTPETVGALQFLRRPFRYTPEAAGTRIDVSAAAPDFVALAQVPPLFLRMLVLSEDAGFFGHPGIDVAEIPVAWAANVERGGFARGASTITQQLARNLFLSRDKSYGRKLEEAALALMLDAAVPKARILEIYVNVIEWGPGLHGLLPAARHYFGKDPAQLTTKEMAFLVCLVPSPIRYHAAHRAGHVGPGMEQLMQNLLAKMRTSEALGQEEYEQARDEELVFRPEEAEAPARTRG